MADQVLKINGTILFKRGSTLQLENEPIIPQLGEPVFDTETRRLKIGDGENRYIDLPYIGECEDEILEGYFDGTKFFADTGKTEEMFGNTATLYVDLMTNKVYRWSGSVFVEISPNVKITESITDSSSDETVPVAKAVYEYGQEILAEGKNEISKLSARHDEEFAAARIEATTALEKEIARAMTTEEEIVDRVASLEDTKDDYIAADVSAIKESNAYADSLNANLDARVKVLEAIDHEAINQELIDLAADYIAADTEITNAFTAEDNAIKANVQRLFDDLALLNEDVNENISDLLNTIVKVREDFESADMSVRNDFVNADNALNQNIITETSRATEAENALDNRIKAIENDYLVSTDKNELKNLITEVSGVANSAKSAIDAFLKDAEVSETAVNTLKEIQAELDAGEASAASMLAKITALEEVDNATQAELDAAVNTINSEINKKANITDVDAVGARVLALENAGHGTTAEIESAKSEAKTYADTLNASLSTRVQTLEDINHDGYKADLENLRAALVDADKDIVDSLTAADDELRASVEELIAADQVLTTEITAAYETYTNAKAEEILEVINNLPSVDLGTVESDLADHKATAEATFAEIRSAFAEADGAIRTEYQNADNILSATCEAENAAIRGEIAAGDLKIATDLASEIARATAAEAQTLTDAKAYTDEVKANLLGSGTLNETYDTLVEISNWIADSGVDTTELTSAIASETADRQKEDAAILAKLNEEVSALDVRIIALDATHTEDLSKTNANLTTLGNELRQEDNSIKDSVNALRAELKAYFDTQLGVIENGSY